jgi:two-component system, NarL family, nitrate/nitrite response regulator NarL
MTVSSTGGIVEQEGTLKPIEVLLVSDVLLTRAGLGHLLSALGFMMAGEAGTVEEAVSFAERRQPDIIILDLDSDLDAIACVEDILPVAGRSRVIALSDRHHAAEHSRLIELGAAGLVLRSDPPETLVKAIRKVHAGEVWLDRANTANVLGRMARRQRLDNAEGEKIGALTRREHEIIALIGEGLKNAAIAERLFISEATVRNHLTSIFDKLDLSDRFELAVYAFRHGLVQYPQSAPARRSTPESG